MFEKAQTFALFACLQYAGRVSLPRPTSRHGRTAGTAI
nr:MAG TPA: hypothetical protein [Caudoviricetes sp.]